MDYKDIQKLKRKLLVKYPAFAGIITSSEFLLDDSVVSCGKPTACTDGDNVYFNPKLTEMFGEDELLFFIAHEVSHIAFDHIGRCKGKDMKLWNIATDAVINYGLKRDGIKVPEMMVNMPEAKDYDAEGLYELLVQRKKNKENPTPGVGDDNISFSGGSHDNWDKEVKKKSGKGQNDKKELSKRFSKLGEKRTFDENRKLKKEQLENLRDSLISESLAGKTEGNKKCTFGDVGVSKPLINWRRALRDSITYELDWSSKNATIEYGVVTSHLEKMPYSETEILLDTSGSVSEELLKNFLRECKNIIKSSRVKVGCFDTKFYGFNDIRSLKDIDTLEYQGRGGTDFEVAAHAFSRRVENKIIFTDGYATMPKEKMNIIWVVYGDNKIKPNGGKVIYVDENELNRRNKSLSLTH